MPTHPSERSRSGTNRRECLLYLRKLAEIRVERERPSERVSSFDEISGLHVGEPQVKLVARFARRFFGSRLEVLDRLGRHILSVVDPSKRVVDMRLVR